MPEGEAPPPRPWFTGAAPPATVQLTPEAIAALRAGIDTICIPKGNEVEVDQLPDEVRRKLNIIACDDVSEVFEVALAKDDPPCPNAS